MIKANHNYHHQIQLPDDQTITITFVYLPTIDLYVITDAKGFGQNWIRVSYWQKVYDSKLLLGIDDQNDTITSIARHLAGPIVQQKLSSHQDQLIRVDEIVIHFSISLRRTDAKAIKFIREEFEKYFHGLKN